MRNAGKTFGETGTGGSDVSLPGFQLAADNSTNLAPGRKVFGPVQKGGVKREKRPLSVRGEKEWLTPPRHRATNL